MDYGTKGCCTARVTVPAAIVAVLYARPRVTHRVFRCMPLPWSFGGQKRGQQRGTRPRVGTSWGCMGNVGAHHLQDALKPLGLA